MDQFTREFFSHHNISLNIVIDASNMSTSKFREICANENKYYGYNTNLCNEGHRIKTKHGKCPVCRPVDIGFINNNKKDAYTYIAVSKAKKIIKIGITSDIEPRKDFLNDQKYGNASDWEIVYYIFSRRASDIESKVQTLLKEYSVEGTYIKDGKTQKCYELFNCSFVISLNAVEEVKLEYPKNYFSCEWQK